MEGGGGVQEWGGPSPISFHFIYYQKSINNRFSNFDICNKILNIFSTFCKYQEEYLKKWSFCFANFSTKTRSTEKIEYTATKPTENTSDLSSQIFDFGNFVTEIFCHKVM